MGWLSKTVKKAVKSVSKTFKAAGNILTGKANSSDWLRLGGQALGAVGGYYGGTLLSGTLGGALSESSSAALNALGQGMVQGGGLAAFQGAGAALGSSMGAGAAKSFASKKPANLDTSASDAVSGVTAESGTGSGKDYEARRKAGFHYGRTLLS